MAATQANRPAKVTSPLGSDVLLFSRMVFTEELSRPFTIHLDLVSEKPDVALADVLGKVMTVELAVADGGTRHYSGYVSRFGLAGVDGHYTRYRAELVPWLWFLTRKTDCRIFQNMTAPDILKQVFRDHGYSDFEEKLSGTHPQREFWVQYRETDFNFVSRLMEEEGIYYFFKHEAGKNTLVLADSYSAHEPYEGYEKALYLPPAGPTAADVERIYEWEIDQEIQTGSVVLQSYDFENPGSDLTGQATISRQHAEAAHERYEYNGRYLVAAEGDDYAKAYTEAEQAGYEIARGQATTRGICSGYLLTLEGHPRSDQNREYLILSSRQDLVCAGYESGEGEFAMTAAFTAMESGSPYRTPRRTPKPRMRGPHTAVVTGPSGEEIFTDKYGRVKVQFHWDRDGQKDENTTCFIRVAQMWSGATFGGIHVPRIKEEVIVDFIEGDPDRPLIVGRVYNAANMPPYTLPDNMTQMGVKTRSSPGGGADNFNELRFEDKKDAEEIYFHAEKDFNRVVENNDTLKVGFDKQDPGDQTIEIYNNRTTTIDQGNDVLTVKTGNRETTIETGNDVTNVDTGNREATVKTGNEVLNVDTGNRTTTIKTGNDTLTISTGDLTIKVETGKVLIEAMTSIELKVGENTMKFEQSGITLKGIQVGFEGSAKLEAKSPLTTVKGDGTLTLKGGMTMIN